MTAVEIIDEAGVIYRTPPAHPWVAESRLRSLESGDPTELRDAGCDPAGLYTFRLVAVGS